MKALRKLVGSPASWLLIALLAAGVLVFRDYGLTWDEPLFYKYGDALGYAYSPANWFSGHFDLNLSYGPSGDDQVADQVVVRQPIKGYQRSIVV